MTALTDDVTKYPALEAFLDEHGMHYQVIDGAIVVNPPASFQHEDVVGSLFVSLRAAAPPAVVVLGSNFGFFYEAGSFVLADVTVARRSDCRDDGIHVPPLLMVEVLSPSTRHFDLTRKREIYEQAGVPSYWLIDPVAQTLTVLELQDLAYVETARLTGAGELFLERPFAVRVSPFGR